MGLQTTSATIRHALGRMRPVVVANQLAHPRELRPAGRRYRDLGIRKPWFATVRSEEVAGRGKGVATLDLADGLDRLDTDDRYSALDPALQEGLRAWPERGYLVAEGFFDRATVSALNADIEELSSEGAIRRHHRGPRFMNVHERSEVGMRIATDPRVLELLGLILGRPAHLFQTIYFVTGSQQEAHSDAFHMMTEPPGFLVGMWVALEDIDSDSGPVYYLPGSHRLPYVMTDDLDVESPSPVLIADKGSAYVERMREVVDSSGIEPLQFTARAGDVLFWHHNLIHGGAAVRRDGATRRSLVGHYFAERVLCYHEVTERPALMPAGFD